MKTNNEIISKRITLKPFMKQALLLVLLLAFVLIINAQIISFDMMYYEQPLLYLSNQQIHSFSDLAAVYLHPKILDAMVTFFRPSGHFLLYQIFTPLLGWHNTKGLLVINFIFLGLTGFVMLKLYRLLFPALVSGGYIAFAIFLMHPALMLPKLTVMHFEFAYDFFLVLGLYYFMLFSQQNWAVGFNIKKLNVPHYLVLALSSYVIAVTFKESALMLGPVMACYLLSQLYDEQPLSVFIGKVFSNSAIRQVLALLFLTTVTLAIYMVLLPVHDIERDSLSLTDTLNASLALPTYLFFLSHHFPSLLPSSLYDIWKTNCYPLLVALLFWGLLLISIVGDVLLFKTRANAVRDKYKKSFFFLSIAAGLFLLIPLVWGRAFPWHLNLSLLFLSLIIGFGFEYWANNALPRPQLMGAIVALVIASSTFFVNQSSIHFIVSRPEYYPLTLNKNAVLQPPAISKQINNDSVLVVEDNIVVEDYGFGSSSYPFSMLTNTATVMHDMAHHFIQFNPIYGGTLFRFAYLKPDLKEEIVPFEINNMKTVSDDIVYNWLAHYGNIFCLGYDNSGQWFDRTLAFKSKLREERLIRHMVVNRYENITRVILSGEISSSQNLPYNNPEMCQQACDKNKSCRGFTFVKTEMHHQPIFKCLFNTAVVLGNNKSCPFCTGFVKMTDVNI